MPHEKSGLSAVYGICWMSSREDRTCENGPRTQVETLAFASVSACDVFLSFPTKPDPGTKYWSRNKYRLNRPEFLRFIGAHGTYCVPLGKSGLANTCKNLLSPTQGPETTVMVEIIIWRPLAQSGKPQKITAILGINSRW